MRNFELMDGTVSSTGTSSAEEGGASGRSSRIVVPEVAVFYDLVGPERQEPSAIKDMVESVGKNCAYTFYGVTARQADKVIK